MKEDIKTQLIKLHLYRLKGAIRQNRFFFIPRTQNKNALKNLGLSVSDLKDYLLQLTDMNYYKGPENDHDGSEGFIWVFLQKISGHTIYIKIKLYEKEGLDYVVILSFHE